MKPYVVVLRTKQGELGAIKELDQATKSVVRPLFELTRPTIQTKTVRDENDRKSKVKVAKELGVHLTDLAKEIENITPGLTEVWVDDRVARLPLVPASGMHPLTHFFSSFESPACPIVPVVDLHRDASFLAAAHAQAAEVGSIVIKVTTRDLVDAIGAARALRATLNAAGLKPSQAHLVLDIEPFNPGHIDMVLISTTSVLANVPTPNEWKSFTIVTTALPDNTTDRVKNDTNELFERSCWAMWLALRTTKAPRHPGFGDYGIDHPTTDLDREFYGPPVPMIRYTTPTHWAFYRGTGKPKVPGEARKTDWTDLSRRLIGSGYYRGKDFSAGDLFIQESADGAPGHNGPAQWRRVGVNHHITQVVEQLSSLP